METTCAYHPDRPSVAACAECGKPICDECRELVAEKSVCKPCVQQIRDRVAESMGAQPSPGQPASPVQPVYGPPPPVNPARLLGGIVAGIIVGAIGAFVWDKFVFYTHIQLGLIASGIGWAVGVAVVVGNKGQGGIVPALIGAVLAFCAMIFGWYLLAQDEVTKAGLGALAGHITVPMIVQNLDVMDWIFIAIGVYGGFQVPFTAGRSQSRTY